MAEAQPIRFGQFVVDRRTGLLLRRRTPVKLRRKGWHVLCHLADRPGTLVSVDELLDAVWDGAHVTPQALTNVIAELRAALGDRAREPRYIETVHGLGYRFVGHIQRTTGAQSTLAQDVASSESQVLVGRDEQRQRLQSLWESAQSGRRQAVFVTGEPGIGKSTLVDAFARGLAERPGEEVWVARGQCVDQHVQSEAYMPVLGAIEHLAGGRARRQVRSKLRRYAPTWVVQMPGILPPREQDDLERSLQGTTAVRMLREGAAFFEALANARPILLILEDLHWADPASLDFITSLVQRPGRARLMVVGTLRSVVHNSAASIAHELKVRGRASELPLQPFGESEVLAYLEKRLGSSSLAASLAPGIEARSGGNPLFIHSIIEQLVAHGHLVSNGGGWQLARTADELENELPRALRDFVEGDLAALEMPCREILEAASVAGVDACVHEVAACVGRPVDEVEAECYGLARSTRLLRYLGEAEGPDGAGGGRYGFVHSLYQRSIYDQLPSRRRRALHASVARSLEQRYGERSNEVAARLAAHHDLSGNVGGALAYLEYAADNAQRRFAYREGADYLRDALVRLATLPDSAERRSREAVLRLRLGSLLTLCQGYSSKMIGETFERAWQLSREVKAVGAQFLAGMGLAVYYMTGARYAEAREICDYLLAVSAASAPKLAAVARCWAAFRSSAEGRLEEAQQLLERDSGAEYERGVPLFYDVERMIDSQLALVLVELGFVDQARARVQRALARSRASGTAADLVHAALWSTEAAVLLGDTDAGIDAARLTIDLSEENGFPTYLVQGRFYGAWFSLDRRWGRAIVEMERALLERRRLGDRWQESILLGLLAEAHRRNGDSDAAIRYIDEALDFVRNTGERHFEAELLRLKGLSVAARGEDAAAEGLFRRAITVARSRAARLWELRAAVALGRLLARRRRVHEAREVVRDSYAALPEGFDEPDARAAGQLMNELRS